MSRWRPGEQIARRFVVEGWLASGGMAEVYVAEMALARSVKKRVALKRIHTHLAEDSHFLTMFLDEARVASQLSHPGIIAVHDVVEEEGEVLLVLDYVPGWDLSTILKTGRRDLKSLPIGMAITVGMDIGETLAYVHTAQSHSGAPLNIVHRDVNPSNILVAEDGTTRLLDFGVAKAAERVHQTATASIKGKLAYLAPEQAKVGSVVDHRADIYGLGLILYELVTGYRAISGEGDLHLLEMAKAPQHRPVIELRPETPQALSDLIARLLAIDPDDRPVDGREVASELEQLRSSVTDTQREKIRGAVKGLMGLSSRPLRKPSVPRANPLDAAFAQAMGLSPPRPKTKPLADPLQADPLGKIGLPESEPNHSSPSLTITTSDRRTTSAVDSAPRPANRSKAWIFLGLAVVLLVSAASFFRAQYSAQPGSQTAIPSTQSYIRVTSKPTAARVIIDDKPWPEITPTLVLSPAGQTRTIVVQSEGYAPKKFKIAAKENKQVSVHAALTRAKGLLKIVTEPEEAQVYVDGKDWGQSPISKTNLLRKEYKITVKKPGYQDQSLIADLDSQVEDVLVIKLEELVEYGILDVSSRPWAKVYIDDKLVAESTPAYGLKVKVGQRTIRFENPRLKKSADRKIIIKKDEKQSLVVKLR